MTTAAPMTNTATGSLRGFDSVLAVATALDGAVTDDDAPREISETDDRALAMEDDDAPRPRSTVGG